MERLVELAAKARAQSLPPGSGPYHYIHTRGWHLRTAQTTDGRILESGIEQADREFWIAADGSRRIEEIRGGRPSPVNGRFGPGGLHPGPTPRALLGGHGEPVPRPGPGEVPVDWMKEIRDAWLGRTVTPALQAALLDALAAHQGLELAETTDRVGRHGVAVSAEGAPRRSRARVRRVLVLHPGTGMLLATEETALEAAASPDGQPGTTGATVWLRTGYTKDPDARP